MDITDLEDDDVHMLTRSNSWSHTQRPIFLNQSIKNNGLSCIYETDDISTVSNNQVPGQEFLIDGPRSRSKSVSGGNSQAQLKKRRHSYTELIASAILSSPEKRKTLAEIYDWFVLNVPSFKDQRYMHSSLGWKNAVRHNLSVQTCFKRVKRHGMEKPSWWTVDLAEVSKRRLVLRPTISNEGDSEFSGPFLPPRRNTYSGPHSTITTANCEDDNSKLRSACRISSTTDLTHTSFPNSNMRRTHYPPIRPAVTTAQSIMDGQSNVFSFSNGQHANGSPFHEHKGLISNEKNDDLFLKPCAMASPPNAFSINTKYTPSVTLVCRDSPTPDHLYQQAQLEVSLLQPNDSGQLSGSHLSPVSSPNWSYTSISGQTSPSTNHTTASSPNHFGTWPNMSSPTQAAEGRAPSTCAPNQTLRVKTMYGNVQDISFNGLLPLRTVVKCDGVTQTEEAARNQRYFNSMDTMNKDCFNNQWTSAGDNQCRDQFNRGYSQTVMFDSDLPDDLAGLQIEGDLHCDIDEVLGASFEPIQKSSWPWSDQSTFENATMEQSFLNVSARVAQSSSFNCGKMEAQEM